MSNPFQFIWLDDKPDRREQWRNSLQGSFRGEHMEAHLEIVPVNDELLLAGLDRLTESWLAQPPHLIILDHDFSAMAKRPFNLRGSAVAHLLRIRLPNVPIVCVSGQTIQSDDFSIEDISEYTDMFEDVSFSAEENLERLFSIAADFPKLVFPEKTPVRGQLVDVLEAPAADHDSLLRVLPEEFEGTFRHGGSPHRIARWMLSVLLKRPGFLCDRLEAATFLGLTESAFSEKVAPRFEAALYKGPFATETRPLWWTSALADVLYSILPDTSAPSSQQAGRQLPGIEENDYSICEVTGDAFPPPDAVAFSDAIGHNRYAVQRRYTELISDDTSARLGFPGRLRITRQRGAV